MSPSATFHLLEGRYVSSMSLRHYIDNVRSFHEQSPEIDFFFNSLYEDELNVRVNRTIKKMFHGFNLKKLLNIGIKF